MSNRPRLSYEAPNYQEEMHKRSSLPFEMPVEDVFEIKVSKLVCVMGEVQTGTLRKGDKIRIVGNGKSIAATVDGFAGFIRDFNSWIAYPGDRSGILIRDVNKDDIERGMRVISDE